MKIPFGTALLAATILAAPAFAQTTPNTLAPAPAPTATAPVVMPGAPVAPLLAEDAQFVQSQLETNLAEVQLAQLALQNSQDQNVRNFAEKLITDHTYAENTLLPIAQMEHIQAPTVLSDQHRAAIDGLSKLSGPAFDRAYVDMLIRAHAVMIQDMNKQLTHGLSQQINAWVQNTRPTALQHAEIAQQLQASLPHTG